jgi:hypothetical protein
VSRNNHTDPKKKYESSDATPSNGEEVLDEKAVESKGPSIEAVDAPVATSLPEPDVPEPIDLWPFGKRDKNTSTKEEELWSEFPNLTYEGLSSRLTDDSPNIMFSRFIGLGAKVLLVIL